MFCFAEVHLRKRETAFDIGSVFDCLESTLKIQPWCVTYCNRCLENEQIVLVPLVVTLKPNRWDLLTYSMEQSPS